MRVGDLRREQQRDARRSATRQPSTRKSQRPTRQPHNRRQSTDLEDRQRRVERQYRSHVFKLICALAFVVLLIGGGLGVYFSNLFSIQQVQVEGVAHLTDAEMTELAAVPSDTTLLRVDTAEIERNVARDSWVASVKVTRSFPSTLVITVKEREVAAVVQIYDDTGAPSSLWALASDGIWLCPIPEEGTPEAETVSPQLLEDRQTALLITDVPYGTVPEVGAVCEDPSVLNALGVVNGLTTQLRDQVRSVSATAEDNATITLQSGVEIAFGDDEDVRNKERVCLEIMEQYPDSVSYINVRVVSSPTWRSV